MVSNGVFCSSIINQHYYENHFQINLCLTLVICHQVRLRVSDLDDVERWSTGQCQLHHLPGHLSLRVDAR